MAIHKVKTVTKDGEVTININLSLELSGGIIGISANVPGDGPADKCNGISIQDQSNRSVEVVPDELFDELPLANNFGEGDA